MKKRKPCAVFMAIIAAFVVAAACSQPSGGNPVPVITITGQPETATMVKAGEISGSLSVTAEVTESAVLAYRWYNNSTESNVGGTAIDGATAASFTIPTDLTAGDYYYFCEITAPGAVSKRSGAAAVTVSNFEGGIVITPNEEPELVAQNAEAAAGIDKVFSAAGSGWETYQWYMNGAAEPGAASADYTFNRPAGVYNLTVVVTDTAGDTYSGACWVRVQ